MKRKTAGPIRLLGAHVSTSGGLLRALERAQKLGCNCLQLFAANPRGWRSPAISVPAGAAYRARARELGIRATIIHAIYLVNLASPKPAVVSKSLLSLRRDLLSAQRVGACCLVVHPGSDLGDGQGEERLLHHLSTLLPDIPANCRLLLEGMAGTKNSLGDLATLGRIQRAMGSKIGICLDTAHLCATGYDLREAAGMFSLQREIKRSFGTANIGCIHLNDSRKPCGSHRDQHENLGEGFVGSLGLRRFLQEPAWAKVPVIIETPGFDELGPDQKNMQRLKAYADKPISR